MRRSKMFPARRRTEKQCEKRPGPLFENWLMAEQSFGWWDLLRSAHVIWGLPLRSRDISAVMFQLGVGKLTGNDWKGGRGCSQKKRSSRTWEKGRVRPARASKGTFLVGSVGEKLKVKSISNFSGLRLCLLSKRSKTQRELLKCGDNSSGKTWLVSLRLHPGGVKGPGHRQDSGRSWGPGDTASDASSCYGTYSKRLQTRNCLKLQ